jgi:hypothetical protein
VQPNSTGKEPNMTKPRCDFDCWTATGKARNWLHAHKATLLATRYGFRFYENPLRGDEAPILAILDGSGPAGTIWNTHDFDLPTSDPKEVW